MVGRGTKAKAMAEEQTTETAGGGASLDDLRARVRAAEERFERVGEDSRASRRRLVGLIRALGDERQRRAQEIEALTERVAALDAENTELRGLLAELLDAAEAIEDEEGLSALEGELVAAQAPADTGDAPPAPAETPAPADVEEDDLGDDDLEADGGGEAAVEAPSEDAADDGAASEALELDSAAADAEEPLDLGEAAEDTAPEKTAEEKAAEEKSDAETDQLDRILKSIRRITS